MKLLLGGQCDLSVEVHVLSVLCVICRKAFLRSLCCDANLEPACMQRWAGSASMENRALPLHAQNLLPRGSPPHPPPLPIHPLSPLQNPAVPPHPPSPSVLAAPLPAYQKYAWRNNGRSIHTKPGMCLNVAGWVPLFSQSMLCVPCFPLRERETETLRA